jgi:hypothetical protein
MQDRDLVAAVVAGEPDGLAEAYDRYAPSLYAYCHSMLPKAEADEAVQDTFLIAVSRLDGLRDPDRLEAWLYAVARNECLRRLGPAGIAAAAAPVRGSADPEDAPPAVTLPTELRRRVLTACADDTPTGRAHRVSVTHRAGAFGPSGFPKAIGPAGPRWWRVQRRPRLVAAVAVLAALAAAAGITMTMTAGGSQRPQASSLGLGGGVADSSSSPTPGSVSTASSPTHRAAPSASPPTPTVTMPAGAPSPGPSGQGTPKPSASPMPPSPPPSSPPSPSPSASPSQGYLLLAPDKLLLTSAKGQSASGFFVLTATGGPIGYYAIEVPAGMASRVTVSPSAGSFPAYGYVVVTVTVTSKVALSTDLTVEPGHLTVMVVYKIKAQA